MYIYQRSSQILKIQSLYSSISVSQQQSMSKILNKENKLNLEAVLHTGSAKKKHKNPRTNNMSSINLTKKQGKPPRDGITNFDKLIQNLRTERYRSPHRQKTLYEALAPSGSRMGQQQDQSSKSLKHQKSIESIYELRTSRDKSGSTRRRPENLKTKPNEQSSQVLQPQKLKTSTGKSRKTLTKKLPADFSRKTHSRSAKKLEYMSILDRREQPSQEFNDMAVDMLERLQQLEKYLKREPAAFEAYNLTRKYKANFASLVRSSVNALTQVYQEKQSEAINGIENLSTLQKDLLQKQGLVASLQSERDSLRKQVSKYERVIRRHKATITEMKKKEGRVSGLLAALRRHGIDVDRVYQEDVSTPFEESTPRSSEDEDPEGLHRQEEGVDNISREIVPRNHSY